jgi:carbon monoxide dehydrogenase subunit G
MPQASHSVVIHRPVEEVFAFVADGEKCPQWRPGVLDITRVSGDGVGTIYSQGVKGPMGRRISADYQITTYDPNRLLEFQTITGPARPRGRYEFETDDGATRLTFSLSADVGGPLGFLMRPMVQRTMDSEVRTLERLKGVLEG